jgi:hypothetical protein
MNDADADHSGRQPVLPYETPSKPGLKDRDLFGVIVRTFGLGMTIWGGYTATWLAHASVAKTSLGTHPPADYLIYAAFLLIVGVALLKGEWVVRFAYGRPPLR